MDPTTLSTLAAALLSLLFSYVPGLAARYRPLDGARKRLVMLALLALTAGGSFALACAPSLAEAFHLPLTCDRPGAAELLKAFVLALMANQGTYLLAPRKGGAPRWGAPPRSDAPSRSGRPVQEL